MMIVADPTRTTANAEAIAKILADRLRPGLLRPAHQADQEGHPAFVYVARRVPSTLASSVMDDLTRREYVGVDTRSDPLRTYPAGDVAANLVGYLGDDPTEVSGGLERSFNNLLAGKDGEETYEVGGGNRIPLGRQQRGRAGQRQGPHAHHRPGRAVVQPARAAHGGPGGQGRVGRRRRPRLPHRRDPRPRRLPDVRPNKPARRRRRTSAAGALSDVYEPGSVEKVLTVCRAARRGQGDPAHPHPRPREAPGPRPHHRRLVRPRAIRLTLAGVLARSSNIGTALAAMQFTPRAAVALPRPVRPRQAHRRRDARRDPRPAAAGRALVLADQGPDRLRTGLSVNALQMATAVNDLANGGELVSPSLVQGPATTTTVARSAPRRPPAHGS